MIGLFKFIILNFIFFIDIKAFDFLRVYLYLGIFIELLIKFYYLNIDFERFEKYIHISIDVENN